MTELISIATATAHPGRLDDLVRELRARVEPTRAQPGNLEFALYREADAPDTIVAYERWATRADWEHHLKGEHVTSLMEAFTTILAAPPQIRVLTPVADPAATAVSPASVVRAYLGAWQDRDFPAMRRLVADGLRFAGPIDTFDEADAHHAAIKALSGSQRRPGSSPSRPPPRDPGLSSGRRARCRAAPRSRSIRCGGWGSARRGAVRG